jgi:hypothetical protein
LAIASFADYPLRVPSISGLIVIAAVWMRCGVDDIASHTTLNSKKSGTN